MNRSSQTRSRSSRDLLSLIVLLGMVLALLPLMPRSVQAQSPGDLVINEVMQNPSAVADADGEWFEIVNTTGDPIDIDGWTIADAGADSHVISNGGPLVVPANGFLVLGNNTDSATNGGVTVAYDYGDSFFLANGDDELVLSDGVTEIDRVEWDGGPVWPDPNGASMSLNDPANENNDGSNWCEASTPYGAGDLGTPGSANDCAAVAVGLVINEVMQNPSAVADSSGEWFEIANTTSNPVDIDGWTIADAGTDSHVISNGGPLVVPANGFLVLGNNTDSATNGGVAVDYNYGGSFFLANGDDELILSDGATEVDRVEWDGGPVWPDPNGASMSLNDPANDNNDGTNWCEASTPYGDGDLGTPGAANDCAAAAVGLVINEVMQNPSAVLDSEGEWFEIANTTSDPIDIDGWTISDNDSDSHVISNGGPLVVPANGFLVLGNNADSGTNGGVTVDYDYGTSLALANGADELVLSDGATEIDRVEWDGGPVWPDPNGVSMSLNDPANDNNDGSNWCEASTSYGDGDLGTPGAANDCDVEPPPVTLGACDDPATLIHDIQGSGDASPIVGTTVVVEAIVVGDFQNNGNPDDGDLNGFHLQEEDGEVDANAETSEGLFVFAPSLGDVSVGDKIRVLANVGEFVTSGGASSMTQLTSVSDSVVCSSGEPLPTPAEVLLPVNSGDDFEHYEGMRTVFTQALVISEYFNYDRFGEIVLTLPFAGQDRPFQPTAVVEPGLAASDLQAQIELRRITLDDGQSSQNPDFNRHPNGDAFSLSNRFRGGDTVTDAIGVIDDTFGLYRIQPTGPAAYNAANPRTAAPDDVGGNLTVASFNVLNYFLTIDSGPDVCGPLLNQDCRGADSTEEFDRQRVKILSALEAIDADVFGLIEMENTTGVSPLADIVSGLNDSLGAGTYDYIDTGTIGDDAIKVGLIYKPGAVSPLGDYAILDSSVDPRFLDDKNRPVLAQTFVDSNGAVFTVAVNHLKSKGSPCDDVGDPDIGDGQGNCNETRELAAEALVDWLAGDPTSSGDPDFLIIGDLNAYDKEDPIDAVRAGSDDELGTADDYADLVREQVGEFAYSYVFDGLYGYLDHALGNASLTQQVSGTTIWHINADEPDILDYDTSFKSASQIALFEENAYRSSDHDPVIVGLNANGSPSCDTAVASQTRLVTPNHMFVPIEVLGVTDPESDPFSIVIDSIFQDEAVDAPDSGDTAPDGQGVGTDTAEVRAERVGTGNGRVYHIAFTATDTLGGNCSGVVKVEVPVGRMSAVIDDGALFDSTVTP